jgi:hypothetical protein
MNIHAFVFSAKAVLSRRPDVEPRRRPKYVHLALPAGNVYLDGNGCATALRAHSPFPHKLGQILEITAVSMAHGLLAGRFQDYHLVLNTLTVKLEFEFEAKIQYDLSLRIVKLAELHERSSRTIVFN